jgi:hypothetical protein
VAAWADDKARPAASRAPAEASFRADFKFMEKPPVGAKAAC